MQDVGNPAAQRGVGRRRAARAAAPWAAAVAALAVVSMAVGGCAGRTTGSDWIPDEPMVSEGVLACEELIRRLGEMDLDSATESEIERAMIAADEAEPRCRRQFRAAGVTHGEMILLEHRADELLIYTLLLEATLARRFDDMQGYCPILREIAHLLIIGVTKMDDELQGRRLDAAARAQIRELMTLDLQTLDVLSVQLAAACEGYRPSPRRR